MTILGQARDDHDQNGDHHQVTSGGRGPAGNRGRRIARHVDSRGPFYQALAEAIGALRRRYNTLLGKVRQERDWDEALRTSVTQLENRLAKMQESEAKLAKID